MSDSISRRDFLKTSSAVGLATATFSPVSVLAEPTQQKVRVVIAKDPACVSGATPVAAKIQDMVDYAVMHLTGINDKGKAYEALFPKPVTATTKILLKRNDVSGTGTINKASTDALKKGFSYMLNNTFPAANVTIRCSAGSQKSYIDSHDYLINCPVAWCHGSDYGVTLSLKNTMTYLGSASSLHSANKSWLYTNSLNAAIKPKQIMSFVDAIEGNNQSGPGTDSTFTAYTIILSRDIVAADYNALRLMEKQPSPSTSRITTADNQLKAAQTAGLGTCTLSNMEIINIQAPWTGPTPTLTDMSNKLSSRISVVSDAQGTHTVFSFPYATAGNAELSLFDMHGRSIRKFAVMGKDQVVWDGRDMAGNHVAAGGYVYMLTMGTISAQGKIHIQR